VRRGGEEGRGGKKKSNYSEKCPNQVSKSLVGEKWSDSPKITIKDKEKKTDKRRKSQRKKGGAAAMVGSGRGVTVRGGRQREGD